MKIFLDTSSLIKLYHDEIGTDFLDRIFEQYTIKEIYLSDIAKVEFASAIWKKVRTKELVVNEAEFVITAFRNDYDKFTFIELDNELVFHAQDLVIKYGLKGLRTLDSFQLASILKEKSDLSFAITADDLLKSLIELEGIEVK
jgi:predicted nucleic acid-binding protein